jgi:hypothetical protein
VLWTLSAEWQDTVATSATTLLPQATPLRIERLTSNARYTARCWQVTEWNLVLTVPRSHQVTRPGVAMIASAMAVELTVGLLHHPHTGNAPADDSSVSASGSVFGALPHQLRGFLASYSHILVACYCIPPCMRSADDFTCLAFAAARHPVLRSITAQPAAKVLQDSSRRRGSAFCCKRSTMRHSWKELRDLTSTTAKQRLRMLRGMRMTRLTVTTANKERQISQCTSLGFVARACQKQDHTYTHTRKTAWKHQTSKR